MTADLRTQLQQTLGTAITIDRELSGGGMSRVFVATDTTLGRQVVVKMLPSDAVPATSLERFNREIRTAAKLQHPHIVPVLSAGDTNGLPYYTMPFVPGESLRHRLAKGGELSVNETVHVLRDVAAALAYAHGEGVVHRDIKPENVMLSGGVAVVTDFGVAKAVDVAATGDGHLHRELTSLGVALGTPAYMSPEQATADPHVDHRSDIYSFGCVAYEMLTGVGLFSGRTPPQMLAAHVQETPEPLLKRRPSVPPALAVLVMKCLEKRPGDRPQTAGELIAALDALGTPSGGMQPTEARLATVRPSRRRMQGFAVAAIIIAAAVIVAVMRRTPPPVQMSQQAPVANTAELELDPTISPDGKFVAFVGSAEGTFRIFVRQIASGRATKLTGDLDGVHGHPRWSPDGNQIVFEANGAGYAVPAFGGVPRRLIGGDARGITDPVWSPDGRRIAYSLVGELWVANADGTSPVSVTKADTPIHSMAWSPSGQSLAYVAGNRQSLANVSVGTIMVVALPAGTPQQVSSASHANMSPAFLPDGTLLYVSNRDGAPDVYQQALTGAGRPKGEPVRLTTGLFTRTISLSADGTRMAFDIVRNRSKIWMVPLPAAGVASMASARQVTFENERIEGMRISNDGAWLAYDADRGGNSDIYKLKLDGDAPIQVTTDPGNDYHPAWSPRDDEVLFYSSRNGDRDIYIISAEGGTERRVTKGPSQDYYPSWSPDGQRIVFSRGAGYTGEIRAAELQSDGTWSEPKLFGDAAISSLALAASVRFSPDGQRYVGAITDRGRSRARLVVGSVRGGNARTIWSDASAQTLLFSYVWARDDRIFFNTLEANGRYSFWAISPEGGTPRLVLRDEPQRQLSRWDFDTDGKRLFFTLAANESDVWVVDLKR